MLRYETRSGKIPQVPSKRSHLVRSRSNSTTATMQNQVYRAAWQSVPNARTHIALPRRSPVRRVGQGRGRRRRGGAKSCPPRYCTTKSLRKHNLDALHDGPGQRDACARGGKRTPVRRTTLAHPWVRLAVASVAMRCHVCVLVTPDGMRLLSFAFSTPLHSCERTMLAASTMATGTPLPHLAPRGRRYHYRTEHEHEHQHEHEHEHEHGPNSHATPS